MAAARHWISRFILIHGFVGMAPQGLAQQAGSSGTQTISLEVRVDDLDQQILRSPTPKKPFDLKEGGLGAFELVGRYGALDLDEASFPLYATLTASAQKAKAWGVGVNWHFTRAVKIAVNYERTTFTAVRLRATGSRRTP